MKTTDGPFYHGSPLELTVLSKGSVVSPFIEVAKAFSHKPNIVSFLSQDCTAIKHDGKLPGFLYLVVDAQPGDILEMPETDSTHWVIQRDLPIKLVCELPIDDPPLLTEEEVAEHVRHMPHEGYTGFFSTGDDEP